MQTSWTLSKGQLARKLYEHEWLLVLINEFCEEASSWTKERKLSSKRDIMEEKARKKRALTLRLGV